LLLRASVEVSSWRYRTETSSRRKVPVTQPGHARGASRHGVRRPRETIGSEAGGDDGAATSFECGGQGPKRQSPACRDERNLRGKRQDPWRKANDRGDPARCRPCGQRSGCGTQSATAARPGREVARKQARGRPGPEASPESHCDRVTPAVAGPAAGPERSARFVQANAASGNWQPRDTRRVKQSAKCQ
jgi:hypothetical protein